MRDGADGDGREAGPTRSSPAAEWAALALVTSTQLALSAALFRHLRDQLNPDAVAYGRAAERWLHGDPALALNATWGVLAPWMAVPGIACGLDPAEALRAGQIGAALLATVGTFALLGRFRLRPRTRLGAVLVAALYAASASTSVLTSDASYLAAFVWMSFALLSDRERLAGLPRPLVAGALGGLSFMARPVGLPMGIAMIGGSEILRGIDEGSARRAARSMALAAGGWALVAVPWILALSLHYGQFTTSHSPRLVHAAVGPHTDHPWNLPSFTRLHRPAPGRITSWEDPSAVFDPALDWSPFESEAAWQHQLRLIRQNLGMIAGELVGFDGLGLAVTSLVLVPLLALRRRRNGVGWREPWLLLCLLLHVIALAPLHVERRYLWPLFPVALAGLGSLAARARDRLVAVGPGDPPSRILAAIVTVLLLGPSAVVSSIRVAALLAMPPRREKALAQEWAAEVRRAGRDGPIVSWSPHRWKALDAEGLYLAWTLDRPWLGNLATDGHDLADAVALGAQVVVAKTEPGEPEPPPWLRGDWSVLAVTDVEGVTLRDGRYFVLVRR